MLRISDLRQFGLALLLSPVLLASQVPVATPQEAFPTSTAIEESVSPQSLERLKGLVQSFVDDGEIVGAEVLIIRNGRSIMHEGFGMQDKDQGIAMGTDNVFCVRSMTKPLIGTSILMLIADKKLKLEDPVHQYLPSFSGEGSKDITIGHLLSHTSGLPLSLLLTQDLTKLEGIQAVAELGASYELDFPPGTQFQYSDQGTDTLTAVIEVVSGMPAAEFVSTRILEPLGMSDTTCVMTEDNALRARTSNKYKGAAGNWTQFWSPEDPALFPFFLGSQGLYSTLEDYGLFMEFWMRKGRSRDGRLLRSRYTRKALAPNGFPFPAPTTLTGLKPSYGFLMQLWNTLPDEENGKSKLKAFGHSGSDGTHAWAFPDEKAIVLYFTQSRGNATGIRVEEVLSEMFLGAEFDPNQLAPPLEEYLGYYAEDANHRYQAFIRDGKDLALETPGRRVSKLVYAGGDRWKLRDRPSDVVHFERDENNKVVSFRFGEGQEFRFQPAQDLPSVEQVVAKVQAAHRIDLLKTLGPLRFKSTLQIPKLSIEGKVTTTSAWPNQFRSESVANKQFEHISYDGTEIWYSATGNEPELLTGEIADNLRADSLITIFGDWREWYPKLQVIQRFERDGKSIVVVRTGDTSATATTFYVVEESGVVIRKDTVAYLKGMGRLGVGSFFEDYREVSGMLLPFKTSVSIPGSIIGEAFVTTDSFEIGVEVPKGTFNLGTH
ncbi:MAG: CubicO group peptidase (beta-lactamase class C family) [Planctomycetota bacterium]|jgi:CubicO group peptidase (beta-lactamase class C family)